MARCGGLREAGGISTAATMVGNIARGFCHKNRSAAPALQGFSPFTSRIHLIAYLPSLLYPLEDKNPCLSPYPLKVGCKPGGRRHDRGHSVYYDIGSCWILH